jgi:hypothetical protein
MALTRAGDETEVRLVILAQRSRHTDHDDIHVCDPAVIGSSAETFLPSCLNFSAGDTHDIRSSLMQRVNFSGINIKAGNCEAFFAEQQGQRQAHVAHADNADACRSGFDAFLDSGDPMQGRNNHGSLSI